MLGFLNGTAADLLEVVPDAIVVVDGDGRIVFVNSTTQELFGYAEEACLGQPVEMLLPHRYRDRHVAWRKGYTAAPERRLMAADQGMAGRHRDGHEIPIDISLSPLQADGRALVIAAIRDVSDRRRVEEALRQNEERYRLMAENAQDIVYRASFSESARLDYVSPSVSRILDYDPQELYADPSLLLKLVHPVGQSMFQAALASGNLFAEPLAIYSVTKSGELRWMEHRGTATYDEQGQLVSLEGIARDVTATKLAEDALRRSEERYRLLAENAQDIVYRRRLADPPGMEYINAAVERVLGYRPEECYADPDLLLKAVHPDDLERAMAFRSDPGSSPGATTFRFIAKTGETKWIEQHFALIRDDNGVPVAVQGIARDVTDSRAAQEALRQSEARLQAAMENLPFAFWAYDADGRCFLQNSVSKEWWGDLLRKRLDELGLPDELMAQAQETRRRVLNGEVVRHDHSIGADPNQRVLRTIAAPIVSGDVVIGVLGINIDVTEQRRAQALEVDLRASQESERLKDALLSTVSHELRTPISVIRGYATLAADYQDRLDPGEVAQYLRDIDRYALQLERLVTDLLTMSRLEAGALIIDLKPVDVESLVSEAVEAFAMAGGTRDISASIEPGIGVLADAGRIRQVLLNLFDNADKFSEPGAPIEVFADRDGGDRVRLRVRDHGQGVAREELDLIFGRFYRVPNRSPVRGTGLGLAICRSIVEGHGGSIEAALPPGGGLEITLLLPSA
jgi:PAS domain S-box-containing protein